MIFDATLPRPGMHIGISGNIGSTKSTTARALDALLGDRFRDGRGPPVVTFPEPADSSPVFKFWMRRFYEDREARVNHGAGFSMQQFALYERYGYQRFATAARQLGWWIVQDRIIHEDACFAEQAYTDGVMSREELDLYREHAGHMLAQILQPDVIVYLDMTPERCHRNLLIRKRPDEVVPLEYLRVLDPRFRHAMGRLAATGSRVVHVRRDEFIPAEEILVTIDRAVKIEPRGEFLSFTDLVAQVSGRAPIVTGAT